MHRSIKFGAMSVVLTLGFAGQAFAATAPRYDFQAAAGLCQGNSATFAGNLRFRPLSVDNIGTTDQFVSCAFQGDDFYGRGASDVFVVVSNNDTVDHDVTCTLVDGFKRGATNNATYHATTVTVVAGTHEFIDWTASDLGISSIDLPQVQCLLPGKTALNYTGKDYSEDVGT